MIKTRIEKIIIRLAIPFLGMQFLVLAGYAREDLQIAKYIYMGAYAWVLIGVFINHYYVYQDFKWLDIPSEMQLKWRIPSVVLTLLFMVDLLSWKGKLWHIQNYRELVITFSALQCYASMFLVAEGVTAGYVFREYYRIQSRKFERLKALTF